MFDQFLERVRELRDRQVPDGDHRVTALIVIGLLVVVAVVAVTLRSPVSAPRPQATVAPVDPAATPPAPAPARPTPPPEPVTNDDLRAARGVARRFLHGYLPYTYGQAPATAVTDADPVLRAALKDQPPRPTPDQLHRHGRIIVLQIEDPAPDRITLLALIRDEKRTYSLRLTVKRDGNAWVATQVTA